MNFWKWNSTRASAEGVQVRAVQKQNKKNLLKIRRKLILFCYWNIFLHQHLLMTLQISTSDNQMVWHTKLLMWNSTVSTALQQNKQSQMNTWKKTLLYNPGSQDIGRNTADLGYPWDLPREQSKSVLTAICKLWNKQVPDPALAQGDGVGDLLGSLPDRNFCDIKVHSQSLETRFQKIMVKK